LLHRFYSAKPQDYAHPETDLLVSAATRSTTMNQSSRIHEGGCLCGAIRYRSTADPNALVLCHCATCRKASGAPSLGWAIFPAETFAFTKGQPATYRSSETVLRSFCPHCGTTIGYASSTRTDVADVTIASLDEPEHYAPQKEIWLDEKLPWECVDHSRPRYPRSSKSSQPLP
jgi:hypothetical protein